MGKGGLERRTGKPTAVQVNNLVSGPPISEPDP